MGKLFDFLDLFRKGSAVTDPKLWKDRTALTLALTGVILAIVKVAGGLGYAIPISETEAATLAAAVAIAVGLFGNYATSAKVGILPAKVQPDGEPEAVRTRPEPSATVNAVDQHARDYPRDTGGGG
jgi:hypothetical protein